MIRKIFASFSLALNNIRSHFFRTVLSILGIVIGVGALVAILSLIDGMEQYAQQQLSNTTSLKSIIISSNPVKQVNGISLRKTDLRYLTYNDFIELRGKIKYSASTYLYNKQAHEISFEHETIQIAAFVYGVSSLKPNDELVAGHKMDSLDFSDKREVALVNEKFVTTAFNAKNVKDIPGMTINFQGKVLRIVGVIKNKQEEASVFCPITIFDDQYLRSNLPTCLIDAQNIEDVEKIKLQIEQWLRYKSISKDDIVVVTNSFRVEQAAKGFRLFRIVMGLIVGISVLVGGIGVMNVLLISVTERTAEIGVRKAVGANKRDILFQFLSESVTISTLGSLLGLILGILFTIAFVPIIKAFTGVPFTAAYTLNTFVTITIISIVVGIVFGTYPAMRAARLDPVEAIRRE